ncbi:MAG TPA: TlyA family RNA methyltransferase [Rhizomicrobium sp.]|jgi:23S rRNA (cytidine1920-2'-O)/16S rRNA (cytidine1409-2'-O)-methyltransferase|nr:TlyA family RNA methyltransferase [Rhizomicrobium sp.]
MTTPTAIEPVRADIFLVENGFAKSRTEAQSAIRMGRVRADGDLIMRPSQTLKAGAAIVYEKPHPYVSRGALKLLAALDKFNLSPEGRVCLDIGASTGGFTEVLLERGAARVYAIDVGHGQLAGKLKRDARVVSKEGVNARDLNAEHVPEAPSAIVADVSFIGLKLALPPALAMAAAGTWLVALVKPQFEVGRFAVGKGGIVRDAEAQDAAISDLTKWLAAQSAWTVIGNMASPIDGADGNREFLLVAQKA